MAYHLKYEGQEIDKRLDLAGTALQTHQDISHLATKNELQVEVTKKQDIIVDLKNIREGASKGATSVQPSSLAKVATSGNYNDLSNKPTIPSAVTESTVSGWGFTKNTGTYSKPSGGIPKTDLASAVQTSLGKADTALQSYTDTKVTAVENHYTPSEDEAQQIDAPSGEVVTGIKRDAAGHVVGVVTTPQTGGGGGGGITAETDPIFSASPAASITEEKKSEWDNKVDKVSGKQLSTEDFTSALKTKLEGLSNYDDTTLANAISGLETRLNTLVSGDASTAIESFNEIMAFLDGIKDTQDLASIIASIEQQIAAKQDKITDLDAIRSGAAKGATALQSYTEKYTGTITGITMNGESKGTSGVVDLGDTGAYPIVEEANTSVTLTGNRMTRITTQVVDSLEITLPEDNGEATNECVVTFQVDSSSTGAELIVPSNVQWAGGTIPAMSAGKTYEISFLNGCATFLEF